MNLHHQQIITSDNRNNNHNLSFKLPFPVNQNRQQPRHYSKQQKELNMSFNQSQFLHRAQRISTIKNQKYHSQQQKNHQIYFSTTKKYNYMKDIIDKYFDENKKQKKIFKIKNNHVQQEPATKPYLTLIPKTQNLISEQSKDKQIKKHKNSLIIRRKIKKSLSKEDEILQKQQSNQQFFNNDQHTELTKSLNFVDIRTSQVLPPIQESTQDKFGDQFQHNIHTQSISYLNDPKTEERKQNKILIRQNQIYLIYMVVTNGYITHKLKIFKDKGQQILNRQRRASQLGTQSPWIDYKYNQKALISPPNQNLKQMIFKIRKMDSDNKFYTLIPKKYHKKLINSNCAQLKRMITQFCSFMNKYKDKILNNNVNTANMYLTKNQNIRLGQWGFSSFKKTLYIQNVEYQNRIQPIVKSAIDWFIPPEYIAPEILKTIITNDDQDLMSYGSAPDIWSLGIVIFQILTVIPVSIGQKCIIHGKSYPSRNGLLSTNDRDIKKIIKKQEKLSIKALKLIEQQFGEECHPKQILNVIQKCLQFLPENRPSYQDLIKLLEQ